MFYARKHSPLLLTWSQSPDALVVNDGPGGADDLSPPAAPTDAACLAHVRDFPNNTPNATTAVVRNFSGQRAVRPHHVRRARHVPHRPRLRTATASGRPPTRRGGMQGIDRWLELNLDGLRRDVGRNGVVIVTFDENHTSDGAGVVAPIFTAIVPGPERGGRRRQRSTLPAASPMPATGCADRDHRSTTTRRRHAR